MPRPKPKPLGRTPLTLFEEHVSTWKDCTRCELHTTRRKVVLARGRVPCDVVFVGEAPGESENVIGRPFVGPAGKLLNYIIDRSMDYDEGGFPRWSYAITNLVACIPRDDGGGKTAEPERECIQACSPRLREFLRICDEGAVRRVKLVVAVGGTARDWLDTKYRDHVRLHRAIPQVDIRHPASILRANTAQRGLLIQSAIVTLSSAIEEYVLGREGGEPNGR